MNLKDKNSEKVAPSTVSLMEKIFTHEMFTKLDAQFNMVTIQKTKPVETDKNTEEVTSEVTPNTTTEKTSVEIPDVNSCRIA